MKAIVNVEGLGLDLKASFDLAKTVEAVAETVEKTAKAAKAIREKENKK